MDLTLIAELEDPAVEKRGTRFPDTSQSGLLHEGYLEKFTGMIIWLLVSRCSSSSEFI